MKYTDFIKTGTFVSVFFLWIYKDLKTHIIIEQGVIILQDNFSGIKEMYDVCIRTNEPLIIEGRKFDTNETILQFKSAELCTFKQNIDNTTANGGYLNSPLVFWQEDRQIDFAITHGVLSPVSWSILSNSNLYEKKNKSIGYNEEVQCIFDENKCYANLKYIPNTNNEKYGVQGNPNNEPLPLGRRPEIPLKPLPPDKEKYIFCYDLDTGAKILNFQLLGNRIYFLAPHKRIYVDYTFYESNVKQLDLGSRLSNSFLRLTGKMSLKDEETGKVSTVILEIPKIKLSSSLSAQLGRSSANSIVSDFSFTGYPDENLRRDKRHTCTITFLNDELTGEYI